MSIAPPRVPLALPSMGFGFIAAAIFSAFVPLGAYASDDLFANELLNSPAFQRITPEDGLSHYLVTSIERDNAGFMWFGTEGGLNRYDGYGFTVFTAESKPPRQLTHNFVRDIALGGDGTLWIATAKGLNRLDTKTLEIEPFLFDPANPRGLGNDILTSVHIGPNGDPWIGSEGGGLFRFDRETEDFDRFLHAPGDPASIASNHVRSIGSGSDGLWLGLAKNGFANHFDPETETFTRYRVLETDPTLPNDDSLHVPDVTCILEDDSGNVWAGTWNFGIYRKAAGAERFERVFGWDDRTAAFPSSIIMSAGKDRNGGLWFGTRGGGVYLAAPERGLLRSIKPQPGFYGSMDSETVLSMYHCESGSVWLGTIDNGVSRYDPLRNQIRHFQRNDKDPGSLSDNDVYSMCLDPTGDIWIGTDGGGLNRFDPESETFARYPRVPERPEKGPSSNTVISLLADSRGDLWVGSWQGALSRYDRETDTFEHFHENKDEPGGLLGNYIRALCEDASGRIWIGTEHEGLNRLDPQTGWFDNYRPDPGDPRSLGDYFIRSLLCDSKGRIWIGTDNGILQRYLPGEDAFVSYHGGPGEYDLPQEAIITHLMEDRRGGLWIGTDKGLYRMDSDNGNFRRAAAGEGMPGNVVKSILEDRNGDIWVSGNSGIARLANGGVRVDRFGVSDGLRGLSFTIGASCMDGEGRLYFGGLNGFNLIDPGRIQMNTKAPPIEILSLQVMGHTLPLREWRGPEPPRFRHDRNFLTFEFAALDYTDPAENRCKYRLLGLEGDWVECGGERTARYTALDPGTYTFEVTGANNDGVWNETGASLTFVIEPPFWQRPWFQAAAALLAVAAVFAAHWKRVRSLEVHKKRLADEVERQTALLKRQSGELRAANQRLEELSYLDGLTGVANRRKFEHHVKQEWKRAAREKRPLSLVMADIDHFKKYNDWFGHLEGDQCLVRVADALRKNTLRPGDLAARYGGEEFAVLLVDCGPQQAATVAERIRGSVRELAIPHAPDVKTGIVTISLGAASVVPGDGTAIQELIGAADQALYEAKANGRDQAASRELPTGSGGLGKRRAGVHSPSKR